MEPAFADIHAQLRRIMLDAAPQFAVAKDEPGDLVVHTRAIDARTGKPQWFGAVTVKKNYVAYHLMPLYCDPGLGADMSAGLRKRQQGKSCFNFKRTEPELFAELSALTRMAAGG